MLGTVQNRIGFLHDFGINFKGMTIPQDPVKAVEYYKRSAAVNHLIGQYNLALCYLYGEGTAKDTGQGIEWLKKSAEQGNVDAQYLLGVKYFDGIDVIKNYPEAVRLLKLAAEENHIKSLATLGKLYATGLGVEKNIEASLQYYNKAAKRGHIDSLILLSKIYCFGAEVERDSKKSFGYALEAAKAGNAEAQNAVGIAYQDGEGVGMDHDKAFYWVNESAKNGFALGQNSLANFHFLGIGTEKDSDKFISWIKVAAGNGCYTAMYNLAIEYYHGTYVKKDLKLYHQYLRESAIAGNVNGQHELALSYFYGNGCSPDLKEATKWFRSAWRLISLVEIQGVNDMLEMKCSIEHSLKTILPIYHYWVVNQDIEQMRENPAYIIEHFDTYDAEALGKDSYSLNYFDKVTEIFTWDKLSSLTDEQWEKGVNIRHRIENILLLEAINMCKNIMSKSFGIQTEDQQAIDQILQLAQMPHVNLLSDEHFNDTLHILCAYWSYGLESCKTVTEEDQYDNLNNLATVIAEFAERRLNCLKQDALVILATILISTMSFGEREISLDQIHLIKIETVRDLHARFESNGWKDGRYKLSSETESKLISNLDAFIEEKQQTSRLTFIYGQSSVSIDEGLGNSSSTHQSIRPPG